MASSSLSEEQMRNEIARLTATIDQHKSKNAPINSSRSYNPNFKASNKYIRPGLKPVSSSASQSALPGPPPKPPSSATQASSSTSTQVKEVVLGGVAFESSGRSLVRKDLPKPAVTRPSRVTREAPTASFPPKPFPTRRAYKPTTRRGGRNMTLNNTRRPYGSTRRATKRKYSDKPCPRFTTTGACSRGLTCMYQHDPSKIAICWNFLQGNCASGADKCALSHDPTPERTPLCVHFLKGGRCTREGCPFPHVNVGPRAGICRDFAVLGYCSRGLECDKQHVRECPDFAEAGECKTKGCKLPHVIRANRTRKPAAEMKSPDLAVPPSASAAVGMSTGTDSSSPPSSEVPMPTAEEGQLGDEYISLTFNESESSEEESENESDEEEEGDGDEEDGVEDVGTHGEEEGKDEEMQQ